MKARDVCEITCIDEKKVKRVQGKIAEENISGVSVIFKALSDETRMKIIYALSLEDELCVCDVANIVGASIASASHHLRQLNKLGLAKFRKEGKLVFYSKDDGHAGHLVQLAFDHQKEVMSRG